MKSIDNFNFKDKKVLIRVDYNVPLNEQLEVMDTTRIVRTKKTIDKIVGDGGIAILMSHLGRPKGEANMKFSLQHIVNSVKTGLDREVIFLGDVLSSETREKVKKLKSGDVALLENLRFHKGEEKGDVDFAKKIAELGDVYVNDAFGTAHREHASTATIVKFFPGKSYAGYLLYEEVVSLEKTLATPKSPFTAIIGGSKVSTKLNIIVNLLDKVDSLIIAGGMSYTFLHALGVKIGNSIFEPEMVEVAKEIVGKALLKGVDIYLPIDNVCADALSEDANTFITTQNHIPDGLEGVDIGPRSIRKFAAIIKESKTILWNGPVGVFEVDKFGKGTQSIALSVAVTTISGAYSLLGGGDSIAAVSKYGLSDFISYISTGGGAMLEYLEGKELPGIKALKEDK
ncbi:MAG TPA: phosphoglycerate kinase [Bacteroidales bacterium]|nr:phosphoglycerate kinase [Bacteroidales bacterium]HOS58045.1 phosphoglycerate kinase [Bacteroidales bacterium]HRR03770.1 phosphoglycerate kinase [Bacteroidales bacterium]HRT13907.1 phosphoglycerate kinase [Bacteroidales bacterium]HXK73483.1 phosphoglycerate kinase [Bacteroidales bacterium]